MLVTAAAPVDVAGGAAGVYNTVRGLGGALVGGLFAGVVGSAVISRGLLPAEHAYETAWTLCGVFGLAVAALAAIIRTADDTAGDPGGRPLTPAVPSPVCP